MVIFGVSWHSRHATCHKDTGERDGIASKCLQVKERTRNSRQMEYHNTDIIVRQYYLLVTKMQAHQWPKFCESFIFLKSQVDFQTGAGLKLALVMHKTIPSKRRRQPAINTDFCHGSWIKEQKCLYQSVIKTSISAGMYSASWFAFRRKSHRKRSRKASIYPSIPKMYIKFMWTRPRKPFP